MKTLLKSKYLWKFTNNVVSNPKDDQQKFIIDGKKDEDAVFRIAYIFKDIFFNTSGIEIPSQV
jgi:hypothetical protein